MVKREVFNVNEERLKEIMAHETDAEGTPRNAPVTGEELPLPYRKIAAD